MAKQYIWWFLPVLVCAYMKDEELLSKLYTCYGENFRQTSRESSINCIVGLLRTLHGDTYKTLEPSAIKWLDNLNRINFGKLMKTKKPEIHKDLRIRKEIRTLSNKEREDFLDAVVAMKMNTTIVPNKYDALALWHQSDALLSAHDGPNFPSWHRYYLLLFEEALREERPGVTLPYWDSTLDFRMGNPAATILFSEIFLGNGKGVVYTGPFANWVTPTVPEKTLLQRGVPGPNSSLIDPIKLQNVMTKSHNWEILSPTAKQVDDNLESHHNSVHNWVGGFKGHMSGLDTSPMDPVFFLHHCFIDYLWEQFREGQKDLEIDPELDYPETKDDYHKPEREMDNLDPPIKNIDGYSNTFTSEIYQYDPAPTCENKCGGAKQWFLYCDKSINACVSRSKGDFDRFGFPGITSWYTSLGKQNIAPLHILLSSGKPLSFAPDLNISISNVAPPPMIAKFSADIIDPRTKP